MSISLSKFIEMIKGASAALSLACDHINDLNVFPVPDGDTGSNMNSTVRGAVAAIESQPKIESFAELSTIFAKAMLMNARGNSGVILSQIIRGFVRNFNSENYEMNVTTLKQSFLLAKDWSYKSVNNPIEGTILTVIRVISEQLNTHEYIDVKSLFADVISYGDQALNDTMNILEELKTVGVVDSGGYGLMTFLKGMNAVLNDNLDEFLKNLSVEFNSNNEGAYNSDNFEFFSSKKDEGFGYCSEIILNLDLLVNPQKIEVKDKFNLETFKTELSRIGDSLVCTQFDNLVKVHVHTMKPYRLLEIGQKYGEFERIKIENMSLQYEEKIGNDIKSSFNFENPKPTKEGLSVIMTVPNNKIADFVYQDFQVDQIITTEEAGAPSLVNFLEAINNVQTTEVIIITDDSNIILAATEAKKNAKNVKVDVVPGRNLFEAIVCASVIDKSESLRNNVWEMKKALRKSLSAVISTSIKNVNYSNIDVKKDNKIGIINKKIVVSVNDELIALKETIDKLIANKKKLDICYIVCGRNANMENVKKFEEYVSERYGLYCEIRIGDQKVYDYYLGLQ